MRCKAIVISDEQGPAPQAMAALYNLVRSTVGKATLGAIVALAASAVGLAGYQGTLMPWVESLAARQWIGCSVAIVAWFCMVYILPTWAVHHYARNGVILLVPKLLLQCWLGMVKANNPKADRRKAEAYLADPSVIATVEGLTDWMRSFKPRPQLVAAYATSRLRNAAFAFAKAQ